jgi:hypothetical protein
MVAAFLNVCAQGGEALFLRREGRARAVWSPRPGLASDSSTDNRRSGLPQSITLLINLYSVARTSLLSKEMLS